MAKYDTKSFFLAALKHELTKLGYGGQAKIARHAGISKSLLNDILGGRSSGSDEKRRAIAGALGYEDFEAFLDVGRRLLNIPLVRQASKAGRKSSSRVELIELLRENRRLRLEIDALKSELAIFKSMAGPCRETLCDPSARATPSARNALDGSG